MCDGECVVGPAATVKHPTNSHQHETHTATPFSSHGGGFSLSALMMSRCLMFRYIWDSLISCHQENLTTSPDGNDGCWMTAPCDFMFVIIITTHSCQCTGNIKVPARTDQSTCCSAVAITETLACWQISVKHEQ